MIVSSKYIPEIPKNPFNDSTSIRMIGNNEDFPTGPVLPTTSYGWVYKAATKTIKLNWAGVDSAGVAYWDY